MLLSGKVVEYIVELLLSGKVLPFTKGAAFQERGCLLGKVVEYIVEVLLEGKVVEI